MSFEDHIARRDNPHVVTKAQVGLDLIENFPLASETEVLEMSRADRYIDPSATSWIQTALMNYLRELGLVDTEGNFVYAQVDTLGVVDFSVTDGVFVLQGTHESAVTVDIELVRPSLPSIYFDGTTITDTHWSVDISELGLNEDLSYTVILNYRFPYTANVGRQVSYLSNATANLANLQAFRYYNGRGLFKAEYPEAETVTVTLYQDITVQQVWTDVSVADNGYWYIQCNPNTLLPNTSYRVVAEHYAIDGTLINTSETTNIQDGIPENAIVFVEMDTVPSLLFGWIPDATQVSVTALEETTALVTQVINVEADGYWEVDLSPYSIDAAKEHSARVVAVQNATTLINTTEDAVDVADYWWTQLFYDPDREAWYYDLNYITYWADVPASAITDIDFGTLSS